MSFCPKCLQEFAKGIDVCPDCSADLTQESPPNEEEGSVKDAAWIELHSFPGVLYSQMAVELLHREGVPAYSISNFGGAGYGVVGADFVGADATVFVLEDDLELAKTAIEPMIDELPGSSNLDYFDDDEV